MASSIKARISKRVVDGLKPGNLVWDIDINGFGVRCQKAAKVYVLKTRVAGRQRWFTIGKHGSPWTPEKARREALSLLGAIADGEDPAKDRGARQKQFTVTDLAARFVHEHVDAKRKASTAKDYRSILRRIVLPALGNMDISSVARDDVAKLHHSLKATPYQANRTLALLSKMFNWAERHDYRPDASNPCRHIEKFRERSRDRFLSEEELARLAQTLEDAETNGQKSPHVLAAIRLLLFTGARLSEILSLRWEYIDIDRSMILLPDSKTGKKAIYLSTPALEVLADVPRLEDNPHVIVGLKPGAHLVNLQKPWRAIRGRAGLEDVRLHDLRHSFASFAAAGGSSLPVIGKLLGHTQAATTERYAHLAADPLRNANEETGQRLAAIMKPTRNK